jgi:hypothetical protein
MGDRITTYPVGRFSQAFADLIAMEEKGKCNAEKSSWQHCSLS